MGFDVQCVAQGRGISCCGLFVVFNGVVFIPLLVMKSVCAMYSSPRNLRGNTDLDARAVVLVQSALCLNLWRSEQDRSPRRPYLALLGWVR